MSYGVKYIFEYISEVYSHACEIRILERDYTGSATKKAMGASPVLRRDSADNGIAGTSLELTIQADEDGELMELYTVDNKRYMVELEWDGNIIWSGYILPEQYSEPYVSAPYDVAVTASDGLGILKGVTFALTGRVTLLELVKYCCDLTGLSLGFTVWSTLAEANQGGGCAWEKTTLDAGIFAENTCYEVLEKVMTTLDSVITQGGGRWIIEGAVDRNAPAWAYSNALVLQYQPQPLPWVVGSADDDFFPVGSLSCDILPAKKSAVFTYDYQTRDSFLTNWDFANGYDSWTHNYYARRVLQGKNNFCFAELLQYGEISQSISVMASGWSFKLSFKFLADRYLTSMGGDISKVRVGFSVVLTNGVTTYYLHEKKGWSEDEYLFKRTCSERNITKAEDYSVDDFDSFELIADNIPMDGVLTITFSNESNDDERWDYAILVGRIVVIEDVSPGVDITAELVSQASEEGDDVELSFGDAPTSGNASMLYANYLANGAGLTSSWSIAGGASDSFAYTMLKSVCSRLVVPRRQLSGVIQGRRLAGDVLLQDKYSGYLLVLTEYQWRLYDDEMTVTMEQFAPYTEISGSLTESERVTGGGGSEYRSSGENETRVYQMGSGVPMRIVDLPEVTMEDNSVIEVDHPGADRSGKVTIGEVMQAFRERYMEPYFDLSVEGAVGVKGDLFAYGGVTAGGPGEDGGGASSGALSGLVDVALTYPVDGDLLMYRGTHWVNIKQSELVPDLTGYATEDYVDERVDALINGAPAAYDTLKEIADVLSSNVNNIGDLMTAIGGKADKATTLSGYGITDAVTLETNQIITGRKRFNTSPVLANNTPLVGLSPGGSNVEMIRVKDGDSAVVVGNTDVYTIIKSYNGTAYVNSYYIWHSGNLNQGSFLKKTEAASTYVTLDTAQTISGAKTFSAATTNVKSLTIDGFLIDVVDGALRLNGNVFSTGGVSAGGPGSGGSGGTSYNRLDDWASYNATNGDVLSALLGYDLKTRIDNIDNTLANGVLSSFTVRVGSNAYSSVDGVVSLPAYPTSLKNPYSLTVNGVGYDGSAAKSVSITAASLGALTAHQAIYNLTLQSGAFTAGTYTPNSAAKTINVPTKTSHLTNDSGFITSGAIPTSLKNPNALSWSGYSSGSYDGSAEKSITIPTTLPASDVYAWAKASTKPSYTFSEIGSKPTTLSGYGITDAAPGGHVFLKGTNLDDVFDLNKMIVVGVLYDGSVDNKPDGFIYGGVMNISPYYFLKPGPRKDLNMQLAWSTMHNSTSNTTGHLWYRVADGVTYFENSKWKKILTESDNAASATKLATPRTIWGQSFDGTGNVDGNMTVNGNIIAYGGISAAAASDYRLKDNIRPLDGALELINKINVKSFTYNSIARGYDKHLPDTDAGYIAQEFETLLPQYVMKMYESDYLGIRYEKMIPYLTAGIQEVDKKTERIKQATRSILAILERHGASEEEKNEIRNNINLLNN